MNKKQCNLSISGNRQQVTLVSTDSKKIYFQGDEEQARRLSFCIPPMVGGDKYAFIEGELEVKENLTLFQAQDAIDLDSVLELRIKDSYIESILIRWL